MTAELYSRYAIPGLPLAGVTAAVIAGGAARRFGSDKALAPMAGRPLIAHAVAIARAIGARVCVAAGPPGRRLPVDVPLIFDAVPDAGPLAGVAAVLAGAATPFVATLPVDLPLLDPRVFAALYARREDARPVVARSHAGPEPLVAVWPRALAADVDAALQRGDRALHAVFAAHDAVMVSLPPLFADYRTDWFANLNTPADLAAVEARLATGRAVLPSR